MIWPARLCFLVATGLAAWLLWYALTEKPMAGCGPGSPCDRVMGSSWSYVLGVPVTVPALAVYFGLLISSFGVAAKKTKASERAWAVTFALGLLVICSASYFTWLQVGVIHSICKFCTAAHLLSVVGSILMFTQMPRSPFRAPDGSNALFGKPAQFALLALMAFASLVAAQKLAPRQTNFLTIARGEVNFDLREAPVLGDPNNQRYIVSLFDYTCPDCHDTHALLLEAMKKMNGAFSIVSLPLPLDVSCNPKVGATKPKHLHACDYARLGLSMRRLSADFYHQYDAWFFGQGRIPTLAEATAFAEKLVGQPALAKALADPWPNQMIQTSVDIYEKNGRWTKNYRLPQIIIGETVNMGPVRNINDMMQLLMAKLPKATKAHP